MKTVPFDTRSRNLAPLQLGAQPAAERTSASPESTAAALAGLRVDLEARLEASEREGRPLQLGAPALTSAELASWAADLEAKRQELEHKALMLTLRKWADEDPAIMRTLRKAVWPGLHVATRRPGARRAPRQARPARRVARAASAKASDPAPGPEEPPGKRLPATGGLS